MNVEWRRAAAYVICRDDADRLLLTRLSSDDPAVGNWTMPGGGMDFGETAEETALRELYEETGLGATIGPVAGMYSRWYTAEESFQDRSGHHIAPVFNAHDLTGSLRTSWDEGSTDGAEWFTIDEVRELPHVPLVDFVLDLL